MHIIYICFFPHEFGFQLISKKLQYVSTKFQFSSIICQGCKSDVEHQIVRRASMPQDTEITLSVTLSLLMQKKNTGKRVNREEHSVNFIKTVKMNYYFES